MYTVVMVPHYYPPTEATGAPFYRAPSVGMKVCRSASIEDMLAKFYTDMKIFIERLVLLKEHLEKS